MSTADKVRNAITNLETKTGRVLEPNQALAIIDDIVEGKFAVADLGRMGFDRPVRTQRLRVRPDV